MEVSSGLPGNCGDALCNARADVSSPCLVRQQQQNEAPFSISVTQSEGLPPTEIYLIGGEDAVNGSVLEAETPAHGSLSMKDEEEAATKLKHPRAPKNKRHSEPRKFTFDDLTPENSLVESRDEGNADGAQLQVKELATVEESNRDSAQEKVVEMNRVEEKHEKTPEEMEHEEGAYWFAECGLPQIDGQNSFPTVPFDEEPEQGEINLFCNRPPATLTPHETKEVNSTTDDLVTAIQQRENDGTSPETISPRLSSLSPEHDRKVVLPPLSPKSTAVMSMAEISSYQEDLEMAPSDELENRGSLDMISNAKTSIDKTSNQEDVKMHIEHDPWEQNQATEQELEEAQQAIQNEFTAHEGNEQDETKTESEFQSEGVRSLAVSEKIEVPSVVDSSKDSEEIIESPMAASMGDLRQQLDQLQISEALEAVSQSFKEQQFLGSEFCGQQIMDWFGNGGRNE